MTDAQNNPFSNMPEPPAAPDPAQAQQAASAEAYRSYESAGQTQQPYGSPQQAYQSQNVYEPGQAYQPQGAYNPNQQPYGQGYQQPTYQQVYQQPVAAAQPAALYPMTDTDRNLRLIAFIFCILSLVGSCWLIIPLAWMIPMSVISWGIYKGTKANTVAFDVCMLIFVSLVSGILLLCSNKDR